MLNFQWSSGGVNLPKQLGWNAGAVARCIWHGMCVLILLVGEYLFILSLCWLNKYMLCKDQGILSIRTSNQPEHESNLEAQELDSIQLESLRSKTGIFDHSTKGWSPCHLGDVTIGHPRNQSDINPGLTSVNPWEKWIPGRFPLRWKSYEAKVGTSNSPVPCWRPWCACWLHYRFLRLHLMWRVGYSVWLTYMKTSNFDGWVDQLLTVSQLPCWLLAIATQVFWRT